MLVALSSLHNVSIVLSKWAEISETGGFSPPSKSKHPFFKKKEQFKQQCQTNAEYLNKQCKEYLPFPLQYQQEQFEMEPQRAPTLPCLSPKKAALAYVHTSCTQVTVWTLLSSLHRILGLWSKNLQQLFALDAYCGGDRSNCLNRC